MKAAPNGDCDPVRRLTTTERVRFDHGYAYPSSGAMSDDAQSVTVRMLREIQRELADMRDDRTVMIAILNRHDSSIDGLSAEMRALRSQFDRFRNECREGFREMRDALERIEALERGGE